MKISSAFFSCREMVRSFQTEHNTTTTTSTKDFI